MWQHANVIQSIIVSDFNMILTKIQNIAYTVDSPLTLLMEYMFIYNMLNFKIISRGGSFTPARTRPY